MPDVWMVEWRDYYGISRHVWLPTPARRKPVRLTRDQVVETLANQSRSDLNFCNFDFSGVNLSGLDLRSINFAGASFRGAILENVRFSGFMPVNSYFDGTDFTGANLSGANFRKQHFRKTVFAHAILRGAHLESIWGTEMDFSNADLSEASFGSCAQLGFQKAGWLDYERIPANFNNTILR